MKVERRVLVIRSICFFHCFLALPGFAMFEDHVFSAQNSAMGGVFAATHSSAVSVFYNPAIFKSRKYQLSFSSFRPFGLKELNHSTFAFSKGFLNFGVGVGLQSFGNELYKEQSGLFSCALKIAPQFKCGFSGRYSSVWVKNYGNQSSFIMSAGLLAEISSKVDLGCSLYNMLNAKVGHESLPTSLSVGCAYRPVKRLHVYADLYKDVRFPLQFKMGSQIQLHQYFLVRAGLATNPKRLSAGFGVLYNRFEFSYAYRSHDYLNATNYFTTSIAF